jgi:hypothetical protein
LSFRTSSGHVMVSSILYFYNSNELKYLKIK